MFDLRNILLIASVVISVHVTSGHFDDWEAHGTYEFYFASNNGSWEEAKAECERMRSTLATVASSSENEFIINHINRSSRDQEYWIGLNRTGSCTDCESRNTNNSFCIEAAANSEDGNLCCGCRRGWRWLDGEEMDFMYWHPREPTGGNRCGRYAYEVQTNAEGWYWADDSCILLQRYICKRAIVTSSETTTTNRNTDDNSRRSNKQNGGTDNSSAIYIGIAVGLVVVAAIVVIIIIFVVRKQHQKRRNTKYAKPSTGQTTNQQYPPVYANTMDQNNFAGHENNIDTEQEQLSTQYAEISVPETSSKPKPLAPKPIAPAKELRYAEIEFNAGNSNDPPDLYSETHTVKLDRNSYEQQNEQRKVSVDPVIDEYAIIGENSNPIPPATAPSTNPVTPSEAELQAMYAQPMKDKSTPGVKDKPKPGLKPKPKVQELDEGVRVEHISAPLNEHVLYALPDKK